MLNWKPLLALSTVALLSACAGPGLHRSAMGQPGDAGMHANMPQMQHMQAMQTEMREARTPEERQAIMMRHMQAMHPEVAVQPGMPMSQQNMMDLCMQHMQSMHGPQAAPAGPAPAR